MARILLVYASDAFADASADLTAPAHAQATP
jgi:hypothetical protein